jgi:DNA-binding NarL/FixJ family response regulator
MRVVKEARAGYRRVTGDWRFQVPTLLISVQGDDTELTRELIDCFRDLQGVEVVNGIDAESLAHHAGPVPDVIFVDASSRLTPSLREDLRRIYASSFVVIVGDELDTAAIDLGAAVHADAYLRRSRDVGQTARMLLAVAGVAPGTVSGATDRPD